MLIELSAYVLPDDHAVFKLFPGKAYRLAKALFASNTAFLDIRGLDTLQGHPSLWQDKEILQVIKEDRLTRQPAKSKTSKRSSSVDKVRLGFWKAIQAAKLGDLVVVPLGDGINADVAIGEFTTGPDTMRPIRIKEGSEGESFTVFARPVKWRKVVKKRTFGPALIASLHSQAALHLIPRSERESVYRNAYENFLWNGIWFSLFETTKEHFTTADHASMSVWLNGFAALREQCSGDGGPPNDAESFFSLGLEALSGDSQNEMAININSPGWASIRSASAFPFALMALFVLGASGSSVTETKTAKTSLKTVGSADGTCSLEVDKLVSSYVDALGVNRWAEADVADGIKLPSKNEKLLAKSGQHRVD